MIYLVEGRGFLAVRHRHVADDGFAVVESLLLLRGEAREFCLFELGIEHDADFSVVVSVE